MGISFLPITLFDLVSSFLKKQNFGLNKSLYIGGIVVSFNILFDNDIISGTYKYFWGYYPQAGKFHPLYLVVFVSIVSLSILMMIVSYFRENTHRMRKNQTRYLLLGIIIYTCSSWDFLGNYGFSLYPIGSVTVSSFLAIIAYSIIKYRLLDITIAITRTGIFVAVYSLILGIPFALAFGWREQLKSLMGEMWWMAPLISSTVLATVGPSIYLFIQRKAEERLLQEQRQYQATLRRASLGMGRVKDLRRLLNLTVHIVKRTVRLEHCSIYLFHQESSQYTLRASKGKAFDANPQNSALADDSPLIQYLQQIKEPTVYDEIKQRAQDYQDKDLAAVEAVMRDLDAALAVPSFIEDHLLAVIILGKKRSGKLYSEDDLMVFAILANQSALAIENAQFYEEMKKTHEQLIKAEKMATIGTMADGLSHQINNRLHAMGFIAGDAADTIRLKKKEQLPPETRQLLDEIEHSLDRIQDNVKRGGEIVEGLLKYSRKGEEGFSAIDLNKLLDAALEMAQFKVKLNQIDIIRNFNHSIPAVHGNFTQLQEVFFNIIDNSYEAVMQRKTELNETDYRGKLEISADTQGQTIEIILQDNGMGVKPEDLRKLFTPFFTTKLSSRKGTGLGLYVIRKIIEDNHGGRVEFSSEYKQGAKTRILLPTAKDQDKKS